MSSCRYADSAKVEANILDDIYSLQKKRKFDGCVKMFSHFEFKGKAVPKVCVYDVYESAHACSPHLPDFSLSIQDTTVW